MSRENHKYVVQLTFGGFVFFEDLAEDTLEAAQTARENIASTLTEAGLQPEAFDLKVVPTNPT